MAVLRAAQRDGARHGPSAGIGDVSLLSSVSPAGTSGDSPPGCRRDQIAFLSRCTLDRGLLALRPSRAALPPPSPSRWGLVLGCEAGFSRGGRGSSVCKAEKFPRISVNRRDRHQIKLTPRAFKVFFFPRRLPRNMLGNSPASPARGWTGGRDESPYFCRLLATSALTLCPVVFARNPTQQQPCLEQEKERGRPAGR